MSLMKRVAVLLMVLLMASCARAEESPVYASTASFLQALTSARLGCELGGVDEDGDEYVAVPVGDATIHCYLGEDGVSAALMVWYLAEYTPNQLDTVALVCSRLNGHSGGVCFYADESDHTVTATADLFFAPEDAGAVLLDAVQELQELLPDAEKSLQAALMKPEPTPALSAGKTSPAATPTPKATRSSTAPSDEGFHVVITVEKARLLAGPNKASPYVGTARKGDRFPCIARTAGYYIIEYCEQYVFVSESMAAVD